MPTVLEELPYAHVVLDAYAPLVCHYCLRRCDELLECSVCQFAAYCNHLCQKNAWSDHKTECNFICRCSDKPPSEMVRLMSRIILKLNAGEAGADVNFSTNLKSFRKRRFNDLVSQRGVIFKDDSRSNTFSKYCCELQSFMDGDRSPSSTMAMEVYGKVAMNAILIQNDDLNPIALGVYLNLSRVKHSCRPNCVIVFDGAKAFLNCITSSVSIDEDTDISNFQVSYDSIISETALRRQVLYSRYYFICECKRCIDKKSDEVAMSCKCPKKDCDGHVIPIALSEQSVENVFSGKDKNWMNKLKRIRGKCKKCFSIVENLWPALNVMNKTNRLLETFIDRDLKLINLNATYKIARALLKEQVATLHPDSVYVIKTKLTLANAANIKGSRSEALEFYLDVLPRIRHYTMRKHPMIGILEMNIGRLARKMKNITQAKRHFAEAVRVFQISHGTSHPIYLMAVDWLKKCDSDLTKNEMIMKLGGKNMLSNCPKEVSSETNQGDRASSSDATDESD